MLGPRAVRCQRSAGTRTAGMSNRTSQPLRPAAVWCYTYQEDEKSQEIRREPSIAKSRIDS